MSGELEEKKWLVERISDMITDLRDGWQNEYEDFEDKQDSYGDLVVKTRNAALGGIAFIITVIFSLASLKAIAVFDAEVGLVIALAASLTVIAGASFVLNWGDSRLDAVTGSYRAGMVKLNYMSTAFYTKTFDLNAISLSYLDLYKDYARVAMAAQYQPVLVAYGNLLKALPDDQARNAVHETLGNVGAYLDRGYGLFVQRHDEFMDEKSFSEDLRSLLVPFEARYQSEHKPWAKTGLKS